MLTVTVPPDLAAPIAAEAVRLGTTPELLALEAVRRALPAPQPSPPAGTLLDYLAGYVGTVAGSGEPHSQDCGRAFADGLAAGPAVTPTDTGPLVALVDRSDPYHRAALAAAADLPAGLGRRKGPIRGEPSSGIPLRVVDATRCGS